MQIWNFQSQAQKLQKWYSQPHLLFSGNLLTSQQVYERGVASIANSVDLWSNYCSFKTDTSHDSDVIRE
jgi:hypothetical protein